MDQGFARLPGAGYEALHPELKDTNPEDYPDINKLATRAHCISGGRGGLLQLHAL